MRRIIPVIISLLFLTSCSTVKSIDFPINTPEPLFENELNHSPIPVSKSVATPEITPTVEDKYEGEIIVEEAKAFLGYKYVWGNESPEDGFDCSGLVYYLYKNHGYRMHRVAQDQSKQGEKVDGLRDILPGDLVCFKSYDYCPHIGIYIGNGEFIHARDEQNGVVITPLEEYMEKYDIEIRRIVGCMEKMSLEQIEKEEQEYLALLAQFNEAKEREAASKAADPVPTPESNSPAVNSSDGIYVIPSDSDNNTSSSEDSSTMQDSSSEQAVSSADNSSADAAATQESAAQNSSSTQADPSLEQSSQ